MGYTEVLEESGMRELERGGREGSWFGGGGGGPFLFQEAL